MKPYKISCLQFYFPSSARFLFAKGAKTEKEADKIGFQEFFPSEPMRQKLESKLLPRHIKPLTTNQIIVPLEESTMWTIDSCSCEGICRIFWTTKVGCSVRNMEVAAFRANIHPGKDEDVNAANVLIVNILNTEV